MDNTQFTYNGLIHSISWISRNIDSEEQLFDFAKKCNVNDQDQLEDRLAAALLLCTCDSNERKAGE